MSWCPFKITSSSSYILNIHLSCCKAIDICLQVVTPLNYCTTLTTGNQIVRKNNGGVVAQDIMNHHMRRHSHPAALTAGGWGLSTDRPFIKSAACCACRHTARIPHCLLPAFVIVSLQGETQMSPDSFFMSAVIKSSADYCTWRDVVTFFHLLSLAVRSYQSHGCKQRQIRKGVIIIIDCTLQLESIFIVFQC